MKNYLLSTATGAIIGASSMFILSDVKKREKLSQIMENMQKMFATHFLDVKKEIVNSEPVNDMKAVINEVNKSPEVLEKV